MPVLISGAREAGDSLEFRVSIDVIAAFSDWSPLRGSRKILLLVTQGSQNLALGLTTPAASQLVLFRQRTRLD